MVTTSVRRFTANEYHRMSKVGILPDAERTELVNGEIIQMVAKSAAHTSAVFRTRRLLNELFQGSAFVWSQDPIEISNFSEPEPDIAVVKKDPLDYSTHHPRPADVLLLIEVASSSLQYDTETKAPLYAASGIEDYWILDVLNRELHVYHQPMGDRYQAHTVLAETLSVSPLAFKQLNIQIKDMLPPQAA